MPTYIWRHEHACRGRIHVQVYHVFSLWYTYVCMHSETHAYTNPCEYDDYMYVHIIHHI